MKQVLKLSIVLLFTISLSAQKSEGKLMATNISKAGIFKFKTELIDYGTIVKNTDGNRTFSFKNEGRTPILISKIKSSCGCTVASKPQKPIMPGETASINVKYDTKRIGSFSKSITITSNAKEKIKRIRIKGNVIDNAIALK